MIPFLVIAASAGALFLSTGLGTIWPLAWLAPIPVLLLAFRRSGRLSAMVAFAAYFLGSFTILRLFRAGGLIIFAGPPSIAFALAVLAARSSVRRLPPWLAVFAFPSVFTAYEFLYSTISANGTYWSLGYSQTDFLPLLQIVSVTGLWGVIFLLTLVPSAIAVAWHRRDSRAASAVVPALLMLLLAVGYGGARMWRAPDQVSVRTGVTAADEAGQTLDMARAYAARIRQLGADGAEVVVLPEKLAGVTPDDADAVTRIFSEAARSARVTAIVGISRSATPSHNVAMVFTPGGDEVAAYEKHHLVPLIETAYVSGSTPVLFKGPGAQPGVATLWGVAICKDMDFPAWSREYGRRGARLLAVPALDFVRDGRLHSRMAVTRGVENGFAVVRAAGQGVVTVSDAYGRVLAEQATTGVPEARLVQRVMAGPGATFYTQYGDWFGWADTLLAVGLLIAIAVRR